MRRWWRSVLQRWALRTIDWYGRDADWSRLTKVRQELLWGLSPPEQGGLEPEDPRRPLLEQRLVRVNDWLNFRADDFDYRIPSEERW